MSDRQVDNPTLWCDICHVHVPLDEAEEDRTCPGCGEPLAERRRYPWHFKLMGAGTVIYLGYRAYQGIGWLIHHV